MSQAIAEYRHVAATDEFKELERMRHKARHDEVSALNHAKRQAAAEERQKWQGVAKENEELRLRLAEYEAKAQNEPPSGI